MSVSKHEPIARANRSIGAVIFDWAGTTVDFGSCAPVAAFQEIFRREGVEITEAEARLPMGRGKRDHIATIVAMPRVSESWSRTHGQPPTEADIDRMFAQFIPVQEAAILSHAQVIEGAIDTLEWLRQQGSRCGSTTGYTRHLMNLLEPAAREQGLALEHVVCIDEVSAGRPAPWMLLRSAELLNVTLIPSIVAVDDTVVGIEAARRAGAVSIGVAATGNAIGMSQTQWQRLNEASQEQVRQSAKALLSNAGADFVFDSVADIPARAAEIESLIDQRLAQFKPRS